MGLGVLLQILAGEPQASVETL